MKKTYYIKAALGLFMATALLSSCLKGKVYQPDLTGDAPTVDFPVVPFAGAVQSATLPAANATNSLNVLISVGGQHDYTTPTAVTVTILDQTAVAAAVTGGTLLPASVYTTSGLTVNINPGYQQRVENAQPVVGTPLPLPSASEGLVSFVVNSAQFLALDKTKTYVLPLRITSASGNNAIIDQYNTVYYKVVVK